MTDSETFSQAVEFRPVEEGDLELLHAWRSNPQIYEHFREQDGPLEWEDHRQWFATRPAERFDYVITYRCRRVGVVGLDEDGFVGVYVGDVTLWGKGIGSYAIDWICDEFGDDRDLFAEINESNERSIIAFERAGFEAVDRSGDWQIYKYRET